MRTKAFWADAIERAVKTAAQSAIGVFVADVTILSLDWEQAGGIVGTAALVSVLTSVASEKIGNPGTASVVSTPENPYGE
ncbi:hypothetical protein SEA_LTON_19 [Gordonia phage Lton]|uniref:Membrane protein n=1 Tax=Gordonia phage Lamberg TaxID=2790987 RepID=A0A7T3N373_9CAUD|nr:holin [Gordonia phage Lamberg]QPX62254.1 membrane protein [Gordonia phage Lamberg]UXE04685.1 hypothetical protein SEA_NETTUNO_19 [Gordonia phage Nettuno]UXE04994.1 hypothetical protein SEA_LTON_19 [Gordonia phage Lton]